MDKLELKHIVNHALNKGLVYADNTLWNIKAIDYELNIIELTNGLNAGSYKFNIEDIQLVLKPLSELKKEHDGYDTLLHKIAVNLNMIKDSARLYDYDFSDHGSYGDKYDYCILDYKNDRVISVPQKHEDMKYLRLDVANELFKYHIDVYGLIEKELAIDFNTLEE